MARILYSSIADELRGSIQGNTFQRNASGTIVKGRNLQRFSSSPEQNARQAYFTEVATYWSSLSLTDRLNWQEEGILHSRTDFYGRVKNLSGFQWFMLLNSNRLLTGQSMLTVPPIDWTVTAVPSFSVTIDSGDFTFDFTVSQDLTDWNLIIMASAPNKSGSFQSRVHKLIMVNVTGNTVSSIDLSSYYIAKFGIDARDLVGTSNAAIFMNVYSVKRATGMSSQYYLDLVEL